MEPVVRKDWIKIYMADNKKIRSQAEDVLNHLLDGDCPEALVASIQEWLVCPAEKEEKEAALKSVFINRVNYEGKPGAWSSRMFRQWKTRPAVRQEFSRMGKPAGQRKPLYRRPAMRVAAVLLPFLVVAGALFWTYSERFRVQPAAQMAMVTIAVPDTMGAQGRTGLLDGSSVLIRPGSEIAYAEDFETGDMRRVKLNGEAYFSVAKDSLRPFVVETGDLNINVLGTTFNVSAMPGDAVTTVTLYTGRIRIGGMRCDGAQEIVLTPGQQMTYNNATCRYSIAQVDEALPGWIAERLNFQHITLKEIFDRIGWYYGVGIVSDDFVDDDVYSFMLSGREDLDTAMELVQYISLDFTYRIEGDRVIVTKHTN